MELITYIRLINRAFVTEDKLQEIISISEVHNIPVVVGTFGNFKEGPYIERVYKISKAALTVSQFIDFIQALVPYMDMYNGFTRPYTYLEFAVDYKIDKDGSSVGANTNLLVYKDFVDNKVIYKSIPDPLISFKNPKQQERITIDMYNEMINSNFVMSNSA